MEKNCIYAVFDNNALVLARSTIISFVGYDDGGKFYLPLHNIEKIISPVGEVTPLKPLVLPHNYRFKIIRRETRTANVNDVNFKPLAIEDRNPDAAIRLNFGFFRWFMVTPYDYGNDQLAISERRRVGFDDVQGEIPPKDYNVRTWDIEYIFNKRIYVNKKDKWAIGNNEYSLTVNNASVSIESD
jgi:hypothetical protein